ncbi:MAG: hypothetical protein R3C97_06970 [Geminicoccaceae bacterium]
MTAMNRHETFLAYRNFRHLKWASALSLLSIGLYLGLDFPAGHNGGTWLGYGLGTIGALLILWLMWFGMRKRRYGPGNWSLKGWLSAHVYLGLSLVIVGTLHTGFQLGWNIHGLAYILMLIVIISGVVGLFVYVRVPGLMTGIGAASRSTTWPNRSSRSTARPLRRRFSSVTSSPSSCA